MLVKTRYFGEVEIDEDKIITFDRGIIGFENLRKFTLIYNIENGDNSSVEWLQSVENQSVALPVMMPSIVVPDYNPKVEDELLTPLGELKCDNVYVFVTLTVPKDITKMSINLKAPIIINSTTKKGCQVIAESDHPVKFPIYDIVKKDNKEQEV